MTKKKSNELQERFCAFCEFGMPIPASEEEEDAVICSKHGVVRANHVCRRFRYDPLKREPRITPPLPETEVISLDD